MRFFNNKFIRVIGGGIAGGIAGFALAEYQPKQTARLQNNKQFEIMSTVVKHAFKHIGYTGDVNVIRHKTLHPVSVDYSLFEKRATVSIDPDIEIESLRTLYAIAGHQAIHVMNKHLHKEMVFSYAIFLPTILFNATPEGFIGGLILEHLLSIQFSRMCEKNADLSSASILQTHNELCDFLTNSKKQEPLIQKTIGDPSIIKFVFTPPPWVADFIVKYPWILFKHHSEKERVTYIRNAKKIEKSNDFFETEEFKELEEQYDIQSEFFVNKKRF
jgi:hypothetical protein